MFKPFDPSRALVQRQRENLFRKKEILLGPQGKRVRLQGRDVLNFCSNDYLGLASAPELIDVMRRAAASGGVGSGASHMVCGHSTAHHELEQRLADWVGRSRALLFPNGYLANLGVISALVGRHDAIVQDRLNHASLLDGAKLSGGRLVRFAHGSSEHLERCLAQIGDPSKRHCLVATDSVFSMDGDVAPLVAQAKLCQAYGAGFLVDEAHALGVMGGKQSAGAVAAAGLSEQEVPLVMGTLGKAVGCYGAFVAGSEQWIEYLTQFARTSIYTTALPPALCEAASKAVTLIQAQPWRVSQLHDRIRYFRQCASQVDLPLLPSNTAIQPLMVGDAGLAAAYSTALLDKGVWVSSIRPPTVPANSARLRITLSASHSERDIGFLVEQLVTVVKQSVEVEVPIVKEQPTGVLDEIV